ncbi:GTP pyrophosphokinase [Brevundimonas naejangsanensis]|uniref:GTP pyrophosphokinase n=1 Tax=Brevundimonas naejangsanensis TaxID=588932 RepID=UPI003208290D
MPSLDFDAEKEAFRAFYDDNAQKLDGAIASFLTLIRSLLAGGDHRFAIATGRVKDREEAIKKFQRKYQSELEKTETPYEIREHITDIIGLRIVCLYEDEIEPIGELVRAQFETLGVTDKIAQIEGTEDSFGYKGLHLDLKLDSVRAAMPEYTMFAQYRFELQIRTIIQDSWSALDHKIKYKKSIPAPLKRRINTLSALFELADREFRQIRDATSAEIEKARLEGDQVEAAEGVAVPIGPVNDEEVEPRQFAPLNAFRFLRIAQHFFQDFEFEPHKADGFTAEIIQHEPNISRGKFNFYMRENIGQVRRYRSFIVESGGRGFNAFTAIRLCLYAGDPTLFSEMVTVGIRKSFDDWRQSHDVMAA